MKLHPILRITRKGKEASRNSSLQACLLSLSKSGAYFPVITSPESREEFMFLPLHWLLSIKEGLSVFTYISSNSYPLTSPRSCTDSYEELTNQFSVVQLPGRALVVVLWTTARCPDTLQQCIGLNFQMHTKFVSHLLPRKSVSPAQASHTYCMTEETCNSKYRFYHLSTAFQL